MKQPTRQILDLKIISMIWHTSPVFHRALPNYLSEDLERIQRRALRITYPDLSYRAALETAGLQILLERRQSISRDLFNEVVFNTNHSLHILLPQKRTCKFDLRRKRNYIFPKCKTDCCKNGFIVCNVLTM